ncbi:hypothetical protein [Croceicoccus mobilis]|nr:hypothetical protein [Croceicoccus mobilis]
MIIKKLAAVSVAANLALAPIAAHAAPLDTVGSAGTRLSAPAAEASEAKGNGIILILGLLLIGAGAAVALGGGDDDDSAIDPVSM